MSNDLTKCEEGWKKENIMLNHKTAQDRLMDPQLYYRLIFFDFTFFCVILNAIFS